MVDEQRLKKAFAGIREDFKIRDTELVAIKTALLDMKARIEGLERRTASKEDISYLRQSMNRLTIQLQDTQQQIREDGFQEELVSRLTPTERKLFAILCNYEHAVDLPYVIEMLNLKAKEVEDLIESLREKGIGIETMKDLYGEQRLCLKRK
ncbi:hypothetical protein HZB02_03530 [Candidatus Woesearchaeota archaeon]|nr:hypothetical protein [Candidatus Woesearchaeota archaeon]